MRVNIWHLDVAFQLRPWILFDVINISCIAALCRTNLPSKYDDFFASCDWCMIFQPDWLFFTEIIEFLPCVVIFSIFFCEIYTMKITQDSFVHVITAMNVHVFVLDNCCVVWSVWDVLTGDFYFCPAAVKMIEVLCFYCQCLSLWWTHMFALMHWTCDFHFL